MFGNLTQSENALLTIVLDVLRAQDDRQVAGSKSSRHVHLPQPVLRGDVSLGEEQVAEIGGRDVGHAQRIVSNDHRCHEPGQVDVPSLCGSEAFTAR